MADTSGAQAVADAVKRVADAAVAEIAKVKPASDKPSDFLATGVAGGRFMLDGPVGTFGPSGTVKLNGAQLQTREWSSQRVVGDLPQGAKSGTIEVYVDANTVRRSYLTL